MDFKKIKLKNHQECTKDFETEQKPAWITKTSMFYNRKVALLTTMVILNYNLLKATIFCMESRAHTCQFHKPIICKTKQ